MNYWLMKSEPNAYSFDDLKKDKVTPWDGIRNYQARNFMVKDMKIGDTVLFYHSNCKEPAIVGLAEVVSEPYPDFTQFDKNSKYYDPKSTEEKPRWFLRDIAFKNDLKRHITLKEIKNIPELSSMKLVQKGQRLSIQPVTEEEFDIIMSLV